MTEAVEVGAQLGIHFLDFLQCSYAFRGQKYLISWTKIDPDTGKSVNHSPFFEKLPRSLVKKFPKSQGHTQLRTIEQFVLTNVGEAKPLD